MAVARKQVGVSFVDPDSIVVIESRMGSRARMFLAVLGLSAAVLAVYARALWGGFIYLDDVNVTQNMPLRSLGAGLWHIWVHPIVSPRYQPVAFTLLAAEYQLFASRLAGAYLAVNILLHLGNVLLLWVVLSRLGVAGAAVAALLFAVHPMNVQAAGWISQQPLLLCGLFSLLTILVWLRWAGIDPTPPDTGRIFRLPQTRWMLYAIVVVLLGLALGSHIAAVGVPVLLLMMIWWERARISRDEVKAIVPLLVMSVLWMLITAVADVRRSGGLNAVGDDDPLANVLGRTGATWGYFQNLVFPVRLSLVYPKTSNQWALAAAMLVAAGACLAIAWSLRPKLGRGPFAAIVAVIALLLPTLFLRTDLDEWSHRADQFFYFAGIVLIVGLVTTLVGLLAARPKWQARAVTAIVATGLAVLSVLRLGDFQDPRRLWESVLRRDPDSLLALNRLGLLEVDEGEVASGRERFKHALEAHPRDVRSMLNLASSYGLAGDLDTMVMRYHEALAIWPGNLEAHLGLGSALAAKGNHQRALREFETVLAKSPKHYDATYRSALSYQQLGDIARAEALLNEAILLNPGAPAPYVDLGNIAFARGDLEASERYLETATRLNPANFRIYLNYGAQLGTLARDAPSDQLRNDLYERAERILRAAVYLNPDSPEASYNLGGLLFNRGKWDEAVFRLEKAVQLQPQNADFRSALGLAQQTRSRANAR